MKEQNILKKIMLACSNGPIRLWRNNCGVLQDRKGNWVRFGVANPGGSDLIGWKTIRITPEHVDTKIAVFVALEVKNKSGKVSKAQANFLTNVHNAGGIAAVVRSVPDAARALTK